MPPQKLIVPVEPKIHGSNELSGKEIMASQFAREIRKLEVRLEDYMEAEQEFVKYAKECVRILRKLMEHLEKIGKTPSSKEIEKLLTLRRDVIQSLGRLLKNESQVEHEKSHIFESYGALILSLQKEIEKLKSLPT